MALLLDVTGALATYLGLLRPDDGRLPTLDALVDGPFWGA